MSIEEQLLEYFKENGGEEVELETPLVEDGIIDSMGVIELISFIKTTYNIEIDMDDLTIDNFATVNDIMNFILLKREAA